MNEQIAEVNIKQKSEEVARMTYSSGSMICSKSVLLDLAGSVAKFFSESVGKWF